MFWISSRLGPVALDNVVVKDRKVKFHLFADLEVHLLALHMWTMTWHLSVIWQGNFWRSYCPCPMTWKIKQKLLV
jgi:hypothetical protein